MKFFLQKKRFCRKEEIRSDTNIYLAISAVSLLFNGLFIGGAAILRSFSKTKDILVLGVIANITYIVLSYGLIFGELGMPELGVMGSALATLLVRVIGSGLLLFVIWKRLNVLLTFTIKQMVRDSLKMGRLAFPSVSDNMLYNVYQLTILSLIGTIGVTSILTCSYVLSITAFVSLFTLTLTQANDILVGYAKGDNDQERAYKRGVKTSWINVIISTSFALCVAIFSAPIIGLFTDQKEVILLAQTVLWINVFLQPSMAIHMILFHSLKAVGDTVRPAVLSILITWVLAVPAAFIGVKFFGLGLSFIWTVFIVEESVKALIMYTLWKKKKWVEFRLLKAS